MSGSTALRSGLGNRWLRRGVSVGITAALAAIACFGPAARAASPPAYECDGPNPIYLDTSYSFTERAADLVSCMSLGQEVAQLHTNSAPAIASLGLQQYWYWNEGQHGINTLNADTNRGSASAGVHATSFPTNFASTMTWDPELIYQETTAISDEIRGFLDPSLWGKAQNNLGPSASDYGDLTFWAPTVNMDRDPRWGRTDEAFGEDPYLAGRMAGAFVDGYQGETPAGAPLSRYLKVAATVKHYALNNVEADRNPGGSGTNDEDLRDYYTAQFRDLVENAHANGVMTSYNAINGTPSVADTYTVNELLARTYGFDGYTTSDCGAIGTTYLGPPNGHDWAPPGWVTNGGGANAVWSNVRNGKEVAGPAGGQSYAVRAGTELNCTGTEYTLANMQAAIRAGILNKGVLDSALTHVLTTRMQTGEFDPRGDVPWTKITSGEIESPAHQALARTVADDALVLLKNDDVTGIGAPLLPADPAKLSSVVIVGNLANTVTLGGYSGAPTHHVDAVQGITQAVSAANPNAAVYYDSCNTSTTASAPASCSPQTLAQIKTADLVVVFVGTDANVGSEGHDRTTLAMPGNYASMIKQVAAVGNSRMLLAIQANGPVQINDVQRHFPSILFSAYNGQSQGEALADVMFGQKDPSGHLDFTWYRDDAQLPPIENYALTPAHTGGLGRTYMYFKRKPTYPFGYGLSYTSFKYSDVSVTPASTTPDGAVTVSFNVTNTGDVPGATVGQLYVSPPAAAGIETPGEQLAGFRLTNVLGPGQTQHVTLPVAISDLSRWDEKLLKEVVVNGAYQFKVGSDSATPIDSRTVEIQGTRTPRVRYVTLEPDKVILQPGATLNLAARNPWIANDTLKGNEQAHQRADGIVEAVNDDESFVNVATAGVTYESSNPSVAAIDSKGKVTAVSAGVATISAAVDGVSGSTPIVVAQPLLLAVPLHGPAGATLTATTSLPNTSSAALAGVSVTLAVPTGWTAAPTSPSSFATVDGGQTAQTTWQVTVPPGASPGTYQLSARATFQSVSGAGDAITQTPLAVPYSSLAAGLDNPGITDDSDTSPGNFDGGGQSYSAQTLQSDGLAPGAQVTHDGLTFIWPDAAPGAADNVVAAGQTIGVSGSGKTLGLLGAGDYGTATGSGTITYTDGNTQSFTLSFSDWYASAPQRGGDILATFPYHNSKTGKAGNAVSIFYQAVPLKAGKQVQYVTLPDVSQGVSTNQVAMHVFAISIG